MKTPQAVRLLEDLTLFRDTCNVYVLRQGDRALAVDYGSGRWRSGLAQLGIRHLDHVLLTHHHSDQCCGLAELKDRPFKVHAPAGATPFLSPAGVRTFWRARRSGGCPASYDVLDKGIPRVRYDMAEARDLYWGQTRIRFLLTPGHGPAASSAILNWKGKQIVFCGDAAHAGATIRQPFHLEWDHWTGQGVLAAWAGLSRLAMVGMDLLCPSHGPVIDERPDRVAKQLLRKLMRFYRSKLSVCPGERDEYWPSQRFGARARKLLPHLFNYANNGYLLLSQNGEALVVDPTVGEMADLSVLQRRLGGPRITAALVSHYHSDHVNAVPFLQQHHGTRAVLHPWVARPLRDRMRYDVPWRSQTDIHADTLLPETGTWQWNEYRFDVVPFPGQTWWHAAHQTTVDGVRVFFGGDNFQPNSRWNGTGGYCAYNGSRFREGFVRSADLVLAWAPDLLCNGHGNFFKFRPSRFRKIRRWALATEKAVTGLCPSGDLEKDYYLHRLGRPRRLRLPA